jgi:hypothetical protein
MPSQVASLFFTRIQAKFLQHYVNKTQIKLVKDEQFMFYEKWTDKEEKKKKKKKKERTYYSNFDETELQPIKLENDFN